MKRRSLAGRPMATAIALALAAITSVAAAEEAVQLNEVTVTGTREAASLAETPASIGVIKAESVQQIRPTHPTQIIGQVPGAAVAVTNGEGHTTAIRQPFTTSPVYLFLEDGVPIRSTGFFNHNALYEVNIPQSGGIEVVRGPGTALYGSDAIGGIVNVLTRAPSDKPETSISADFGSFGWRRALGSISRNLRDDAWRADLNLTHTDGWRQATNYDRQSGTARWDRALGTDATLKTIAAFSHIEQQTGANSPLTLADYLFDPRRNYLPIAYRKVSAARISSTYDKEFGRSLFSITPYVRRDSMDLLASFTLNSDPTVYREANSSYGVMAKWRSDFPGAWRARLIAGADIDVSPGGRQEDRLDVTPSGVGAARMFSSYGIGPRIYDYDVTFKGISPYLHGEMSLTEKLRVTAGLRYDHLSYDFSNHLGRTPIAVASTFPGLRFYGQAADGDTTFTHLSPKLAATYALSTNQHLFVAFNHGFRVPSEAQLFRPSAATTATAAQVMSQSALALRPIEANQFEIGFKGAAKESVTYELTLYDLVKRNDILTFRDTTTNFTQVVNAGKTRHRGLEIGVGAKLGTHFLIDGAFSYAKHRYEQWLTSGGDFSGKEMEAAPRIIASVRATWLPRSNARMQLEWTHLGSYYLDAANTTQYSGHSLINLRGNWRFARDLAAFAHINNLTDRRYADSASISSGTPVYSPGLPRTLFVGMEATW